MTKKHLLALLAIAALALAVGSASASASAIQDGYATPGQSAQIDVSPPSPPVTTAVVPVTTVAIPAATVTQPSIELTRTATPQAGAQQPAQAHAGGGDTLPFTGFDALTVLAVGALLVGTGLLVRWSGRPPRSEGRKYDF